MGNDYLASTALAHFDTQLSLTILMKYVKQWRHI